MSNEKTGGPAYPRPASAQTEKDGDSEYQWHPKSQQGMTLLDHFAGLAMAAWWADGSGSTYPGPIVTDKEEHARNVEAWRESLRKHSAQWSYAMAAAMIAERNRIMNEKP